MNLNPEHFAAAQPDEYDPLWGDPKPLPDEPEKARVLHAYMLFASPQGQLILQDLITQFMAAPIFQAGRDPSWGYERNGEANVVRHLMRKLTDAQRSIEQRKA